MAHLRTNLWDHQDIGILDSRLLKDIFSTQGIPRMLFQTLVGNSEETAISGDTLMTFVIGATAPRCVSKSQLTRGKIFSEVALDFFIRI